MNDRMSTKHAYLLMVHGDLPLLRTLVRMLDDPRNDIYVHADRKFGEFRAQELCVKRAGLHVLERRIDARWGDTSLMEVELMLMREASRRGSYAYYHLLSGADLPIKTQDYIHEFFAKHAGKEFISYMDTPRDDVDARYKMERYHFFMRYERSLPRLINILVAKLRFVISDALYAVCGPRRIDGAVKKASQWVSLTHECIGLILEREAAVRRQFRFTRACDELFVPYVVLGSPFAERVYQLETGRSERYSVWEDGAWSPNQLTMANWEDLVATDALFARKFSTKTAPDLVDAVFQNWGTPR